jgi:hypothetical protein
MAMHQNSPALLPPAAADLVADVRLIKIHEEEKSSITNRLARSTYPSKKSVLTSEATPDICRLPSSHFVPCVLSICSQLMRVVAKRVLTEVQLRIPPLGCYDFPQIRRPLTSIYVVNYADDSVSAYSIDPATGALTPVVGGPFTVGWGPVSVAVTREGAARGCPPGE